MGPINCLPTQSILCCDLPVPLQLHLLGLLAAQLLACLDCHQSSFHGTGQSIQTGTYCNSTSLIQSTFSSLQVPIAVPVMTVMGQVCARWVAYSIHTVWQKLHSHTLACFGDGLTLSMPSFGLNQQLSSACFWRNGFDVLKY